MAGRRASYLDQEHCLMLTCYHFVGIERDSHYETGSCLLGRECKPLSYAITAGRIGVRFQATTSLL